MGSSGGNTQQDYHLTYREFRPPEALQHILRGGWELNVHRLPVETYVHRVVPEPTSAVVCMHSPEGWHTVGVGPNLQAMEIPVREGAWYTGIRFLPGAAQSLFNLDVDQHVNQRGPLAQVMPELDQLLTASTGMIDLPRAEDVRARVESIVRSIIHDRKSPDPRIAEAYRLIWQQKGDVRLSDVAQAVFVSPRQLRRIIRNATGMNPKQIMRMARLRAAAESALNSGRGSWGRVAADRGYADQAHLARDIRELTGVSPKGLDESVRRIDHQELLD